MIRLLTHTHKSIEHTAAHSAPLARCPTIDFSLVDSLNLGSLALKRARMANSVAKKNQQRKHTFTRSPPTHAKKESKEREREKQKKKKNSRPERLLPGVKSLYSAIKSLALHCGASFA